MRRRVPAGTRIFAQGDPARGFFLVLEGCVKIYKLSAAGAEQALALAGPGETFAEAALFQGGGYPAHAQAVQDSDLLFLGREPFVQQLRRDPELALRILGGLSLKLRRMVRLVEDLSLRDARGRLARYLLTQLEPGADLVRLRVSQAVMARLLGLATETFSRTLRILKAEGLLETDGRDLRVLDPAGLRAAAGED